MNVAISIAINVALVIVSVILINIADVRQWTGGAIFRWMRKHTLITFCLILAVSLILQAISVITSELIVALVIGSVILINIADVLLGIDAILRWPEEWLQDTPMYDYISPDTLTIGLIFILPLIFQAVVVITSEQTETFKQIIMGYVVSLISLILSIVVIVILCYLTIRARIYMWLNYTAFGEAKKFPGGEFFLEKEIDAETVEKYDGDWNEYDHVISALFIKKHYDECKAPFDSQGAVTEEQFTAIFTKSLEALPAKANAEPLAESMLNTIVERGDAKRWNMYVISVPFLEKHYAEYKASFDSQGAATAEQFAEICAKNREMVPVQASAKELAEVMLDTIVERGDAKEVYLNSGTLFISTHPAPNSNFKRREISLD